MNKIKSTSKAPGGRRRGEVRVAYGQLVTSIMDENRPHPSSERMRQTNLSEGSFDPFDDMEDPEEEQPTKEARLDLKWLLVLNEPKFAQLRRDHSADIGRGREILMRFLGAYPEYNPLPLAVNIRTVYELVHELRPEIGRPQFGILFGRGGCLGYPWLGTEDSGPKHAQSSDVLRQAQVLYHALMAHAGSVDAQRQTLDAWLKCVYDTAGGRGLDVDLLRRKSVWKEAAGVSE